MSLPREPRQKMINMMYLVLTALLALNVSAEILNAFKTVNKSLETTNATVNNSTTAIMQSLEDKQNDPKTAEKAAIWLPKAKAVQEYAKSMNTFIQSLKNEIIKEGGGDPDKSSFKADNLDIATRLMLDKGKAKELLAKLTEFKKNILKNVDPSIDSAFSSTLPIYLEIPKGVSKSNNTWERAYFHMVPTVAALTILSKFQNDVKTSENKIVEFCHNKVDKVVVRYDTYAAFAQSNSSYVMPGDEMEVTAGVGAFSKAALPTVTIAGAVTPLGDDGAEAIQVSISGAGGALQNLGKGKYIARVNSVTDDCKITVTVGGKVAGASVFRTRTIPKPIAVVGPYESGASINANAFKAQAGVGAGIKDFPFELKYQVTRFILSADNDEGYIDEAPCQGNLWSSAAQAVLSKLKSGRTITIDDIYATGPDGRSQKLPSLVYYIK